MAAELPRPGVEVIQVFRSVSPTVITPTLVPCVVGVCKQLVEVLTTTASGGTALNGDALTPFQATFTAAPSIAGVYAGLSGLTLAVSLNNGPAVNIVFTGTPLTPAQVVATVLTALGAAGGSALSYTARVVGNTWQLYSLAADENQTIQILGTSSAAVLTAFGLGAGRTYSGYGYYSGALTNISTSAFPDPRNNLNQVVIEPDSVRAFFFMGGVGSPIIELLRTQDFLRSHIATAGAVTGSVVLSSLTYGGGGTLDTLVFAFKVNGTSYSVTFAAPASAAAAVAQINAVIGAVGLASITTGGFLKIASLTLGPTSTVQILANAAQAALGLTVATYTGVTGVAAVDDGNGDGVTPLLSIPAANFTVAATAAQLSSSTTITSVANGSTLIVDDGSGSQTITFDAAAITPAAIASQIDEVIGTGSGGRTVVTVDNTPNPNTLHLTSSVTGIESRMTVVGGTAAASLFFTAGTTAYGLPFNPAPGDEVFVDGVSYATITQVMPGGNVSYLKINRQVPIDADLGLRVYIVAKNLVAGNVGRPSPQLVVDGTGNFVLKNDLLRDQFGVITTGTRAQLYVQYRGVRQDVTAKATNPGLLRFNDTTGLSNQLDPISADNPLALGLYFALLNAPGTQVTAVGVDAVTANAPFGTPEAFARAATFLESYEVYGLAPLSHDDSVGQVFNTHVSVMSAPENKGERVVLMNPSVPTSKLDTLVGSGTKGQTPPSTTNVFDTGIANLGALLLAQGVAAVGPLTVGQGVWLDIGDGKKYSVTSVSGANVTLKVTGFLPGENDDGYYATTTLPSPLIDEAFAIRIRGVSLTLTDGTKDKDGIALTMQKKAQGFLNRRYWQTFPDKTAATLGGIEQVIDGFYMNAAVVGMIGKQAPQQSFTNFPMTGFTRVIGSNDTFSERQLNVIAAGGNYIIVQDDPNTPLISRMALTTDMTSIETRTDSITKVIDFSSKFMRRGLKNFIGRFNITQGFLDSLGHVIQGLGGFLIETGTLIGFNLNNIIQEENAPDTVLCDSTLDVPFPCNYIRLTLAV